MNPVSTKPADPSINEPSVDSIPTRAVGPSRSGTESLCEALLKLGFTNCYHGWQSVADPRHQQWDSLIKKKYGTPGGRSSLTAEDFDGILGSCRAVTDFPAAFFARDLIEAYPDAKVILNHREDIEAWYRSFDATLGMLDGDKYDMSWLKSWFCAELFWIQEAVGRKMIPLFFRGSFARNGKWVYEEHVAMVRGLRLPPDRFLEWTVQEGWQPLCQFLGRDTPDEPFPKGNTPADFAERLPRLMQAYQDRARRNMIWTSAVLGLVAMFIIVYVSGGRY